MENKKCSKPPISTYVRYFLVTPGVKAAGVSSTSNIQAGDSASCSQATNGLAVLICSPHLLRVPSYHVHLA